ncbi:MAG: magnesium transporter [Planctomycetes bacterium]|nr:magnesium transporter [Planctomycetota bacterium]MBU4398395.1 magnesium transporter [Planctomycetota bacterium]MCG2684480.1 magnesium transporter [Planctomycetales bacterium]
MVAPVVEANLNDPVVQHMRKEVARLHVGHTVGETLAELRRRPPPARIVYFYVVDDENRLKGVIPTRSLLLSPPEARIAEIMLPSVVAVPVGATVLDACEFFVLHRFLAFPVVDSEQRLVGAIDVELYTDELLELSGGINDDLFQLVGVHLARARQPGTAAAFRTRFPWLVCNIAGGIAAAMLSGIFREQLERAVALVLFIPVVLALAESVSIQSVSLALQLLHGRSPSWALILKKLRREFLIGLMLGAAGGLVVGTAALAWLGQPRLALSVLGGIAAGVTASAVLGAATPNLLRRFKLDPQVAAGPIVLAATDLITLLCYFNVARWLLP